MTGVFMFSRALSAKGQLPEAKGVFHPCQKSATGII
jgi:hypothetical protein